MAKCVSIDSSCLAATFKFAFRVWLNLGWTWSIFFVSLGLTAIPRNHHVPTVGEIQTCAFVGRLPR